MRHPRGVLLASAAVGCVLLLAAVVLAFNGRVASHFGYALPGNGGLPSRITYAGRHYISSGACWSTTNLQRNNLWPLYQVAHLPTLLGAAHPILSARVPPGMTTMALAIPNGPCDAVYSIAGGP